MSGRWCGRPCRRMVDTDVLVLDAGFEIRQLQEAGATRYVVRAAKNVTGRRATLPSLSGAGASTQAGRADPPARPDLSGPGVAPRRHRITA